MSAPVPGAGAEPSAPPIVDKVSVRMYRKLLGDCFVVTIAGHAADDDQTPLTARIMIDCGVLQGTANAKPLMTNVVEDVYRLTGGEPLDLIVVTHEHHDHISGFSLARETFERVSDEHGAATGKLWFAWTEDSEDCDARHYQERYGHAFATMSLLAQTLKVPNLAPDDTTESALGLFGFAGPPQPLGAATAEARGPLAASSQGDDGAAVTSSPAVGSPARGSRKIYENLRRWAGPGNTEYRSPGQVLATTPGAIGLKTYVLGPPRDNELLTKSLPTANAKETYLALSADTPIETAQGESPFAPRYRWRADDAVKGWTGDGEAPEAWLHHRYYADFARCGGSTGHASKAPREPCAGDFALHEPQAHRRLDGTARAAFSNLALRMDDNTNNTSLVLAFELPDGAMMLFAADAQVGNWLSWGKVKFRPYPDPDPKAAPLAMTSRALLGRTRFYKVGHHGSHNATLRGDGLELMNDDLVAMIPTDADFALKQSSAWLMPNPNVEEALQAKTRGQVLRGDKPAHASIDKYCQDNGPWAEQAADDIASYKARITDHADWIEYVAYELPAAAGT